MVVGDLATNVDVLVLGAGRAVMRQPCERLNWVKRSSWLIPGRGWQLEPARSPSQNSPEGGPAVLANSSLPNGASPRESRDSTGPNAGVEE